MKSIKVSFLLIFLSVSTFAQVEHYAVRQNIKYELTSEEQPLMPSLSVKAITQASAAPVDPINSLAETQSMQGVIIAYPLGIPVSFVRDLSQLVDVKVLVNDDYDSLVARQFFASNGVDMSRVSLWKIEHDSYWVRDYGPWFVIDGNDEVGVIDFVYNRPSRPLDDASMTLIAQKLGMPIYAMPMVHTGGNYMCDGYGVAASTTLLLDENPNESYISLSQIANEYLGITNYMMLEDPLGEYIEHIDCWGKFLDVDKVLIAQLPTSDPRYTDYEAVANYFATHSSSWGNNYQVYRVFEPGSPNLTTPYTNSLIIRDHVFVPIAGTQYDEAAIEVYEEAMPGYTIVPVMQAAATPWENTDALHCRTHEFADKDMLYIKHFPILGSQYIDGAVHFDVTIKSLGEHTLISDSLLLYYRINEGEWQNIALSAQGGAEYGAELSGLQNGQVVDYYIFAKDETNRRECHPYIGAADSHRFTVSATGVNNNAMTAVNAYPNPAVDYFFVEGELLNNIIIYNALGQIIHSQQLVSERNVIECTSWPSSIYYLAIQTADGQLITKKLMKF